MNLEMLWGYDLSWRNKISFFHLELHLPCSLPTTPLKGSWDGALSHSELSSQRELTHVFPLCASHFCSLSSSGVAEVEMTVPDTITEWKAGALCLSNDTGLGLSSVASLQAFQPFFVELTMPYSVIRGEAFMLKATVLNYLPTSLPVNTFLN